VGDVAWSLFADFVASHGPKPTLIEWDTDIPDYATLMMEANKAQAILNRPPPPPFDKLRIEAALQSKAVRSEKVSNLSGCPADSILSLQERC
jgi:hypothetical protein